MVNCCASPIKNSHRLIRIIWRRIVETVRVSNVTFYSGQLWCVFENAQKERSEITNTRLRLRRCAMERRWSIIIIMIIHAHTHTTRLHAHATSVCHIHALCARNGTAASGGFIRSSRVDCGRIRSHEVRIWVCD